MKIIPTLFLIILSSCTCNWHLNKAKQKCGLKTDTVYVKDTLLIPSVTTDTIFKYFQKDTVIVREGRLTMKYFYNSHDSTVFLSGKCDTVFVVKEIPVSVKTEISSFNYNWFWLLLVIPLVWLLRRK